MKEQHIRMCKAAISSCTKNKGNFSLLIVAQCVLWFVETMHGMCSPTSRLVICTIELTITSGKVDVSCWVPDLWISGE
jgi:hypothetical protein